MRPLGTAHLGQEQDVLDKIGAAVAVSPHQQVVQYGGMVEQLDILEGPGDAQPGKLVRAQAGDVAPVKADAPLAGLVDPRDQVEDGRLAGAVGADDGKHLARLDREGYAVDRPDPAELDGQILDLQQAHRIRSVFR